MTCIGFTCRSVRCKNKGAYNGLYCTRHLSQDIPIKYYTKVDESFPYPGEIMWRVHVLSDVRSFKYNLNKLIWLLKQPDKTLYERRTLMFVIFETYKKNKDIIYGHEKMSDWGLRLADGCLSRNTRFTEYLEDFKKTCIKSYYEELKHKARKKLVMFYMIHCEGLCYDVVEHMMTFY
jgi:hypothetical protein